MRRRHNKPKHRVKQQELKFVFCTDTAVSRGKCLFHNIFFFLFSSRYRFILSQLFILRMCDCVCVRNSLRKKKLIHDGCKYTFFFFSNVRLEINKGTCKRRKPAIRIAFYWRGKRNKNLRLCLP